MGEIVRLQKYIAMSGAASRRGAEELIAEGRVAVNGKTITEQMCIRDRVMVVCLYSG